MQELIHHDSCGALSSVYSAWYCVSDSFLSGVHLKNESHICFSVNVEWINEERSRKRCHRPLTVPLNVLTLKFNSCPLQILHTHAGNGSDRNEEI